MKSLLLHRPLRPGEPPSKRAVACSLALALLFLGTLTFFAFAVLQYNWNWGLVYQYREKFYQGWLTTVALSCAALLTSCLIGAAAALSSRAPFLPLRYLAKIYIEVARGTPLLVQILIFFYVFADSIHLDNRYVAGVIVLSLFCGAYIAEIFRAGIDSVGRSQLLSAKSLGFTPYQTLRYIIFPQALWRSLPALAGQFANLVKDSSLLSIIAVSEFTLNGQEVNAFTASSFESFLPLAIGYLALTLPIFYLSRRLEARLLYDS